MAFFDEDGMNRAELGVDSNGVAVLMLTGKSRKNNVILFFPDGEHGALIISDREDMTGGVLVGFADDGTPTVSLGDKNGNDRLRLTLTPDGQPGISLLSKDTKLSALLALLTDDRGALMLLHDNGKVATNVGVDGC